MNDRLVFLHFFIQPVMGTDDGTNGGTPPLSPDEQPQPKTLSIAQLQSLIDNWPIHFENLKAQYEMRHPPNEALNPPNDEPSPSKEENPT